MMYTRTNVWANGGEWSDPAILWYARGVAAMQARALADPTGWRFYAAMHGIDQPLWRTLGHLSKTDKLPSSRLQKTFWKQCQHQSWYFLPWHRGYLLALEASIRAAVVQLKGPADWALPYWNYFAPNESGLPPAFATPDWPDGTGTNPLFIQQRYGPNNDGKVYVPLSRVDLKALSDPDFTGVASGGSPGFGGVDTGFSHSGTVQGGIESQPHNAVHGLVGGSNPTHTNLPGLMSDPDTAGLDPIFYLHHANIDRLWEVWRLNPPAHVDPTDPNWLKGPGNVGERVFAMPMPNGTTWNYTPGDMSDLGKLGYNYSDLSPAAAVETPNERLLNLGFKAVSLTASKEVPSVQSGKNVELVGANQGALSIQGTEAQASVQLSKPVVQKVSASLNSVAQAIATAPPPVPDRVFLNLENVRGASDATAFQVYVGLPEGAEPADHPELLAGTIALFGVRKASIADGEHGGEGLTYVLEITDIVDALHLNNVLDVDSLNVRIVPVNPVPAEAKVSIGRLSIFRQGV